MIRAAPQLALIFRLVMAESVLLSSVTRTNTPAQVSYYDLCIIRHVMQGTVRELALDIPSMPQFLAFESAIKYFHNEVVRIMLAIREPMDRLVAVGLKIYDNDWSDGPINSSVAFEEVRRILIAFGEVFNDGNKDIVVEGHRGMYVDRITTMLREYPGYEDVLHERIESMNHRRATGTTVARVPGASEDQINGLVVFVATEEDGERTCSICLEGITSGEDVRFLRCDHCFHRRCIDQWLRYSSSCPADRSNPF